MEVFEIIGRITCGAILYIIMTLLFGGIVPDAFAEDDDHTGWGPWLVGCGMFVAVFAMRR